jgi:AcrR family transcriptional regulator
MTVVVNISSRRERKKEETRARLLSTAMKLMREQGFDGITVEALAEAADVGKGTVYNYFKTKEDIVVAFFVDLERRVQVKVSSQSLEQGSLEQILTAFLQYQFRLKVPHLDFVRIFLSQMFARPEQMFPYVVELQGIIDPPLIRLFESLQARKLLRRDAPMELLVLNFKTMHFGLSATWALEGPPWRGTAEALPRQVSLFCSGLEAKR